MHNGRTNNGGKKEMARKVLKGNVSGSKSNGGKEEMARRVVKRNVDGSRCQPANKLCKKYREMILSSRFDFSVLAPAERSVLASRSKLDFSVWVQA